MKKIASLLPIFVICTGLMAQSTTTLEAPLKKPPGWLSINAPLRKDVRLNAVWSLDSRTSADVEMTYHYRHKKPVEDTVYGLNLPRLGISGVPPQYTRQGFSISANVRYFFRKNARRFYFLGGLELGREKIILYVPELVKHDLFSSQYVLQPRKHSISPLGLRCGIGRSICVKPLLFDIQLSVNNRRVTNAKWLQEISPLLTLDFKYGYIFKK